MAITNRDLLLDFFLTFSRFEFALKNSGYFVMRPNRRRKRKGHLPPAEADWDSFAASLQDSFDSTISDDLQEASRYLSESPPNRQVIFDGAPAWETPTRGRAVAEIAFLIRAIRTVRNNLFHGGKYSIEVHEAAERTEKLLESALTVIKHCLVLAPDQRQVYDEASL